MSGDIARSRIEIRKQALPGGALSTTWNVYLDGKMIASRLFHISDDEARDLARAATMPVATLQPLRFDKVSNSLKRGRPSAAAKAAKAAREDAGEPDGDEA